MCPINIAEFLIMKIEKIDPQKAAMARKIKKQILSMVVRDERDKLNKKLDMLRNLAEKAGV